MRVKIKRKKVSEILTSSNILFYQSCRNTFDILFFFSAPVNVIDNYFTPQATTSSHKSPAASGSSYKPPTTSGSGHKPSNVSSDKFFNSSSSSNSSNIVGFSNSTNMMSTPNVTSTSNNPNRGQKILSLVDLNVKKNGGSLSKSSNQTNNSKGPDKNKFVQLPGQKNIFRFINDW